ncbi:hypothetical protein H9P43_003747 [Blastocladiella emersonii ATCC 22665]|nr:hypothetical protein H9P43_003747 [Blastocladiella emersonii ATCC 22665]
MLTPHFSVSQDDEKLTLLIKCPHVRASSVETLVSGTNFRFHCKPYFLSLHFDHELQPDHDEEHPDHGVGLGASPHPRPSATYDPASGFFTFLLPKRAPGTHFADLDLVASLLSSRRSAVQLPTTSSDATTNMPLSASSTARRPLIQELDDSGTPYDRIVCDTESIDDHQGEDDEGEDDWEWEQHPQDLNSGGEPSLLGYKYGFGNNFSGVFAAHQEDLHDLLDIPDPDSTSVSDRRQSRLLREDAEFDEDHYMYVE